MFAELRGPRMLALIGVLALIWGCNWPVLKIGVTAMPPLTFRALTIPFAGLGMLLVARLSGHSLVVPRAWWGKIAVLAALNVTGWNALVLFGVRQMPSGRSAILAFTMPIWATLIAFVVLDERLSRRKLAGFVLGMTGMLVLLGEDVRQLRAAPAGTLLILGAAMLWAMGTVLLRRWRPTLPQTTLSGWMMVTGCIPLVLLAPWFDPTPLARLPQLSAGAWFAIGYNIFLAGTIANWIWFMLARSLPVALSSLASLPIPVVGVFAGMAVLGERPGPGEWAALALVVSALALVMLPERPVAASPRG